MSPKPVDQDPSSVDFEKMSKRRHVWIFVAIGLLVVTAVVVFVAFRALEREHRAKLNKSWSELSTCLLGARLQTDETPSLRVRNVQLVVIAIPPEKRAKHGELAWPATCTTYAHAVAEQLRSQGSDSPLAQSAESLAKELKNEKSLTNDLGPHLEKAWADASALALEVAEATDAKPPPDPVTPLNQSSLPKTAKLLSKTFNLKNVHPSPNPGATLRFVVDEPGVPEGPVLCSTSVEGPEIRCVKVPEGAKPLSPGLRLWGTVESDAQPLLFGGDRGAAGIFTTRDGKQVAATLTYGAFARKNGSVDLLTWSEKNNAVSWSRATKGAVSEEISLLDRKDIGNPYYTVALLWGWVVYKAYTGDEEGLRLVAIPLPKEGGKAGEPIDAGKVWEHGQVRVYDHRSHITACKTEKAIAVRVAGTTRDSFSFYTGGKWTPPVPGQQVGGELSCRDAEATTTRIRHRVRNKKNLATIHQSRCNVSACEGSTLSLGELLKGVEDLAPADAKSIHAADVDGNIALVWKAGEYGGIRMRFAPAGTAKESKDRVIYDDLIQNGTRSLSTVLEFRLLVGQGFSLLFLSTVEGVFVVRIDAKGQVAPAMIQVG